MELPGMNKLGARRCWRPSLLLLTCLVLCLTLTSAQTSPSGITTPTALFTPSKNSSTIAASASKKQVHNKPAVTNESPMPLPCSGRPNMFPCADGLRCIPLPWKCDNLPDCADGSDEPADCPLPTCHTSQFKCLSSHKCIPLTWVCDGEADCLDSSDENLQKCLNGSSCPKNSFRCEDGTSCPPIAQLCDGTPNCPDQSDEGSFCQNTSMCASAKCSHDCRPSPNGPLCFCPDGLEPNGTICSEVASAASLADVAVAARLKTAVKVQDADECSMDATCDQLCTNSNGSYACDCVPGYRKEDSRCWAINVPESEPATLLFVNSLDIRHVHLNGTPVAGASQFQTSETLTLDFDHRNKTACWIHHPSATGLATLRCALVSDLTVWWDLPQPPLFTLNTVTQISKDWVSGNWYLVDDAKEQIWLCDAGLTLCVSLMDFNISKPRCLTLDPTRGLLFLTVFGTGPPRLESAWLDGSNRQVLVDTKIVYPYGVTVDYPLQQLYWVDTFLDVIERVDYHGGNRKTIKKGNMVQNLYGITVFERYLYVTSWRDESLVRIGKWQLDDVTVLAANISRPFAVHIYHKQRQPDAQHPCSVKNGGCQHLCIPQWKKATPIVHCVCAAGFRVQTDGSCTPVKQTQFLLYAQGRPASVKGIALPSSVPSDPLQQMMVPITELLRPVTMDYDVSTQFIYYSDRQRFVIERQKLDGSQRKSVIDQALDSCEGLAVDWMGRNLYWTDEGRNSISVARLENPALRRTLLYNNMSHPRAIILDPKRGYLYWSDWSSASNAESDAGIVGKYLGKIERAWMDGSHREVFVGEALHWPNGLALDSVAKKLYFCDAFLDRIERIGLDGKDREIVVEGKDKVDHPYGLAYLDNTLIWTEMQLGKIQRYSLLNKTVETITQVNRPIFGIRLFDNTSQTSENECTTKAMNCPEFCLSTPRGAVCGCKDGYEPDPTESSVCVESVNRPEMVTCREDQFMCIRTQRCISVAYVCDGKFDCNDKSDEDTSPGGPCQKMTCNPNQFQCLGEFRCISSSWLCDGDIDCEGGSDEDPSRCRNGTCSPSQFACALSGRCIPKTWECDLDSDCGNGDTSDEHSECEYQKCDVTDFTCENQRCVSVEFLCDGDDDCKDNSDEKMCQTPCQSPLLFLCEKDGKCISASNVCNGVNECSDGSDERNCVGHSNSSGTNIREQGCPAQEFQCDDGHCIPSGLVCNFEHDCLDGSDEQGCSNVTCRGSEYQCADQSKCIPSVWRCDGTKDCEDGSDEVNCPLRREACVEPSRLCDNRTLCINVTQLCDGVADCIDGSDEGFLCEENLCGTQAGVDCSHQCHIAPEGYVCLCPPGMTLAANMRTCVAANPCQWGTCSQLCKLHKDHYKCDCEAGYALEPDGFTCKTLDRSPAYLVFSNRHELRGVDLSTMSVKSLVSSLKNTIALDFYHNPYSDSDYVFWTDVVDDKIYRGSLIGGSLSNVEVVVQTGLATAEGLAVDWIGENLYWVESNLDQIEVSKLNGSFRRTLIAGNMESPRAIALDPRFGILFWTDWESGAPRIESCSLSGEGRRMIVRVDLVSDGAWPNGLTLDYVANRLYWIDARSDSIHSCLYNGNDAREILRGHESLSHPFAITLFENHVYWSDWRNNLVVRANKWNGSNVTELQRTMTQPFDLIVMHPSRQPRDVKNPCGENNGGCTHLCLLSFNHTFQCACPHVMKLDLDGKTCVQNERVLLFSRPNEIRGVDVDQSYYHVVPPISLPHVLLAAQIDFHAPTKKIYWADTQVNEIKRVSLFGTPIETIIDTAIENPFGLAIDWLSGNLFYSSYGSAHNHIAVCTLEGEYLTRIITEDLYQVKSLAVDPMKGLLFWAEVGGPLVNVIYMANMDGTNRTLLSAQNTNSKLEDPRSLIMDLDGNRLYWVNYDTQSIQYYDFATSQIRLWTSTIAKQPHALVIFKNLLYYADQEDGAIHVADKTNGANDTVVRKNTSNILSLRLYEPSLQGGKSACGRNRGGCQHLCLPIAGKQRFVCKCAAGYRPSPTNASACIGEDSFLLYSMNWELKGLALIAGPNGTRQEVLAPIPRVFMATSIDYHANTDTIFWVDSDHGSITRVRRDGSNRQVVVQGRDSVGSLAIDWVAGNMYWTNPKFDVLEVSRWNGSHRYVVVAGGLDKPVSLAIDPRWQQGYMFWADCGKAPRIERSRLDGSGRSVLVDSGIQFVTDIVLDFQSSKFYWCDSRKDTIERANYDGTAREVLLERPHLDSAYGIALYMGKLYWIDATHEGGSIKEAPLSNVSNYSVMKSDMGDSLKALKVFSSALQKGTNPCAVNNGGCEELCLYNGTIAVCACSHGRLAADRKTCEAFEAFLLFSRVSRIESIHIEDERNLNAPFPAIESKELMRNAIGLSYDYNRQLIFYSDIQRNSISSVHFNGSNHRVLVEKQVSVEGLAYDTAQEALYWTCNSDSTINKLSLGTVPFSSAVSESLVEKVVRLGTDDKPRGIAIDPCGRRMYWTNWNSRQPSVQRAYLNGFEVESIITTDIRMPNAIALDLQAQKLYWGDARLDKIERTDLDGSNRHVLSKVTPQHPFDLAVYGDFIFWTDWILHAVLRANKYTGEDLVWLRKEVPRPMGIVAVVNQSNYDCSANPCQVLNGGCEDNCRLNEHGMVLCSCYPGRVPIGEDGRRCAINTTLNGALPPGNCTEQEFQCTSGRCIPYHFTCDGVAECPDFSDELPTYCAFRQCIPGYFQCSTNRCIPASRRCDGSNDCGDHSDEINCTCTAEHFRCKGGHCISRIFRCDSDPDCPDASDEMDCPPVDCDKFKKGTVPCPHTTACVMPAWFCDGSNDCWDNSDELNCTVTVAPVVANTSCQPGSFSCRNGLCLKPEVRCNNEDNCRDTDARHPISSDEEGCEHTCRPDDFKCKHDNLCIPLTFRCDGSEDCPDGSDESQDCKTRECRENEFRCNATGRCIPNLWVCDGDVDCAGDGSDEDLTGVCNGSAPLAPGRVGLCKPGQLMCRNRRCIPQLYYCDGDDDCGDRSDEPASCLLTSHGQNGSSPESSDSRKPFGCPSTHFTCRNGKCVYRSRLCDLQDDCGDGSDEEHKLCANPPNVTQPTACPLNQFRCRNRLCIAQNLTCNGENDCGDYSDEDRCNINECKPTNPCAHECVDLPIGYECRCRKGYKIHPSDAQLCIDIDECQETQPCAHTCRNVQGSYVCSCSPGYLSFSNGKICHANSSTPATLLFSNRYYIREMDIDGGNARVKAHNLTNAVALDFDWQKQCFYWSDVTASGSFLKRICGNDTTQESQQVLLSSTLHNPDGLAVDWVGRNLYWCDKGTDTIEVAKLDGKFRKILISQGLQEPRAIAVDPHQGYMYWSDWGDVPHIGKAGMDGSGVRVIVNTNLGWPNALAIAPEASQLFWADAREDYIAVSDLDGNNPRIVFKRGEGSAGPHHIFAISVFEEWIYFTDWETKSVEKCTKFNCSERQTLTTTIHRPMDIQVYHPYRQLPRSDNPCENNGGCATLCLLNPEGGRTCACPEDFVLAANGTCVHNCSSSSFVCETTHKCIPFWWKCDTQDDCGDRSDEPADCAPYKCTPGLYQCANNHCIHASLICNGVSECGDNSDEKDCDSYSCMSSQFKCKGNDTLSARCIPAAHRCDNHPDCPLGDDEENCPPKVCSANQFQCQTGKCIPAVWICDGDNDCGDSSDELKNCSQRECKENHFRCHSGRCIPLSWKCDGDQDCAEGEDEAGDTCSNPDLHSCEPTYFRCDNNRCIPGRWKCDWDNDCGDNSDERDCVPRNCSESEFRCGDGRCIRGSLQCNGEFNCQDRSDEANCNATCSAQEFQCHNPQFCIFGEWRCDGDMDCADGSDELYCNNTCGAEEFTCGNGECVSILFRCDGDSDCLDKSDEDPALCQTLVCPPGKFRCANYLCIPQSEVCDNFNDCVDGSDEEPALCHLHNPCNEDQFHCSTGHCIDASLVCNGFDDCTDGSDENENSCKDFKSKGDKKGCAFGTCSQICVEKKGGNYSCHCDEGYVLGGGFGKAKSCQAIGDPAYLVIANENNLRRMNPYKPGETGTENVLASAQPFMRIEALDAFISGTDVVVVWTNPHSKSIMRYALPSSTKGVAGSLETNTRKTRSSDVSVLFSGLDEPRGVAVDWIGKNVYWTDSSAEEIWVGTLDGKKRRMLIDHEIYQPQDIAVDAQAGVLYWTSVGYRPRIESSRLDGTERKILIETDIIWPTGIALDLPAKRLYWADPKAALIESIDFDGKDRQVVKKFRHNEDKPWRLDVFEDSLFILTHNSHNIVRLPKHGPGQINVTSILQGVTRVSDLMIVHPSKQLLKNISDPCATSLCGPAWLCLRKSLGNYTCVCPDNAEHTIDSQGVPVCAPKNQSNEQTCDLDCHVGNCYFDENGQPKCKCHESFEGEHCEKYRCSGFCRNKGFCYPDLLTEVPSGMKPPLKCNCPPEWTGERCETRTSVCADRCQNGGTCMTTAAGGFVCICPEDFSGKYCQNCVELSCLNGGMCRVKDKDKDKPIKDKENAGKTKNKEKQYFCECPPGYQGEHCEISDCDDYCMQGECTVNSLGVPQCTCGPGYSGSKCEHDLCIDFCQNGGTCQRSAKKLTCECPSRFTGKRCEADLCTGNSTAEICNPASVTCPPHHCLNGGSCVVVNNKVVCNCGENWGGEQCKFYFGPNNPCRGFCLHGGVCVINGTVGSTPSCVCPSGWSGVRCQHRRTCNHFCFNGGTCSVNPEEDLEPSCTCPDGFFGLRCQSKDSPVGAQSASGSFGAVISSVIIVLLLIALAIGAAVAFVISKRRRRESPFMHVRMESQDNVVIRNPTYDNDADDGEDLQVLQPESFEKATNFANPVYELFADNDTAVNASSGNEEKKSLLTAESVRSESDQDPLADRRDPFSFP